MENKNIVAVSGGPDSMHLLYKLKRKWKKIVVAHVNYNFRPESEQEKQMVLDFCRRHNIKVKILNVDKDVLAKYDSFKNKQSMARHIRYDFFMELAKEFNSKVIYMGHHKNDFIETAIMQEKRSTELLFYGIKKSSNYKGLTIKRPQMNIYKDRILHNATRKNIPFMIDQSNFDPKYERNALRIRLSQKSNKELEKLYKHFRDINRSRQVLDRKVNKAFDHWKSKGWSEHGILTASEGVRKYMMYRFFIEDERIAKINNNKVEGALEFIVAKNRGSYRLGETLSLQVKEGKIKVIGE